MTHPFERLTRFLAVSRRHLLDGVMPSRRVPRRAPSQVDGVDDRLAASVSDVDGWGRVAVWPRLAAPPAAGTRASRGESRAGRAGDHSNENRPSATSFASG